MEENMKNMEENKEKIDEIKNKKGTWKKAVLIIIAILVIVFIANTVVANTTGKSLIQMMFGSEDNCDDSESEKSTNGIMTPANTPRFVDFDKPIIYLYPTEQTEVEVKLGNPEKLSCTYPEYKEGWNVIANPDGNLTDIETGRNLYALYWEGKDNTKEINLQEGFCIKGEDTAKFLEEKLEILGLSPREAEEFIIYWLPKMENNNYNYIRFETIEEQNQAMPLEITPKPDTTIRVMMDWKGLDEKIEVKEQRLETQERTGFVAVEWGGSELTN